MYKLLIVDDENLVRVAFRTMVDYEQYGFTVCGTAADGEEALRLCAVEDPDLIITDIKMPRMDGITLIERLTAGGFTGKIVLISNYDDFDLVRQGMVLGAQDYLLKLTITTQEYTAMLGRMKQALDETMRRRRQDELARTALDKLERQQQAAFWQKLLLAPALNEGDVPQALFAAGPINLYLIQVVQYGEVMKVSSQQDMELLTYALLNIAAELLGPDILCQGPVAGGQYFVVTPAAPGRALEQGFLAQKLCSALTQYLNVTVAAFYQPALASPAALLAALARRRHMADRIFYLGGSAPIPLESLGPGGSWNINIPQFTAGICEALRCADLPGALAAVDAQLAACGQANVSRSEALHKWSAILLRLHERMEGFLLPGAVAEVSGRLDGLDTQAQLRALLHDLLRRVAAALRPDTGGAGAHEVEKTLQYIHAHIGEKITLAQLAKHVNFNETYLCTVFRARTGASIVNYINQTKMEKAAECLRSGDVLLKTLAADLGFSDQFYFNKLFRKYYGISPTEYRKKQQDITSPQ